MSTNSYHKNGPFVSHVAGLFCLFVTNFRKCQYLLFIAKSFAKIFAKMLVRIFAIFVSFCMFLQAIFVKMQICIRKNEFGFNPVLRIRIHIFLGLPDPDPLVRNMDPDQDPDPAPDSDPSIIMQK
jgi:hypothetical protein